MAESTEGVVLRRADYSETSVVAHFYTPDFGQVAALAKGAKRPKSAFQGCLEVLTRNQIVFARRGPGGLATLMESAILDDYLALRSDLGRLIRTQYCAELVSLLTTEEDPNPALYGLLVETLEHLASGTADVAALTLRFEIGVLAAVGYGVEWDRCVSCGNGLRPGEGAYLSPAAGGVVCTGCAGGVSERAVLAPGVLAAARSLAAGGRRAQRLRLAASQTQSLGRALGRYITYLVGRPPKMLKYIGAIDEPSSPTAKRGGRRR